ncbi:MAG: respiratory nitrate reductase subunit gamma [Candidatus Hydrothermarchaeales archaeon]
MVTRVVFWGVSESLQNYFYLAAGAAVLIFLLGLWSRISIWTAGSDDGEFSGYGTWDFIVFAVKSFFSRNCILARKSFGLAAYRGVMLLFIIWGFSVLFLGTALLTVHHYSLSFLVGKIYLLYSFALDLAGLLLLIGLLIAIARRYLVNEVRQVTSREDLFLLYLLLFIVLSGFAVEGMRLAVLRPPNMDYSYGGVLFSYLMGLTGIDRAVDYVVIWGVHVASVLFLIAYLPFSKFFHVFASQVSVAAAEDRYGQDCASQVHYTAF